MKIRPKSKIWNKRKKAPVRKATKKRPKAAVSGCVK